MKKIAIITVGLLIFGLQSAFSQFTVSGKVMDLYTNGISEVTVSVQDTDIKTLTDKEGNYTLNVTDKNAVLVFTKKGLMTENLNIEGKTKIDIVLINDPERKEE